MKKLLMILAAAVFAFAACEKEPADNNNGNDDNGGKTQEEVKFAITSDLVVNLSADSAMETIKFTAPAAWTAEVEYTGEVKDYVVLSKTSGEKGENEVKVTVQSLPEGEYGRYFFVNVKCGSDAGKLTFYQGKVFIVSDDQFEFGLDGGNAEFTIVSNLEYTVTTYADAFPWAGAQFDQKTGKGTFTVAKSDAYDARTAYMKFIVSKDVIGTEEDYVVRVYAVQEGNLKVAWVQQFTWAMFPYGTRESIAVAGDYLVINCSKTELETGGAYLFNRSDGAMLKAIDIPSCTGITNDDAGNIIITSGGDYPWDDDYALIAEQQTPLYVFLLPKNKIADMLAAEKPALTPSIVWPNGFWGYGLDNVRVTGDITGDAVITMCTSGGYGDFYAVDWEVKSGAVTHPNAYTAYTALPNFLPDDWTMGIWTSYDIVAKHLGTTADSPLYYMGYDNNYNLQYLSGSNAEWAEVLVSGATWEEGFNCFATAVWEGHKYLSFVGTPYFAWADWDYDGNVDGYMPGHLWLVNIDDPANPVVVSKYEYWCDPTNWQYGDSADVRLEIEGNDLVCYMVDAASSQYMKVVYPKL